MPKAPEFYRNNAVEKVPNTGKNQKSFDQINIIHL